MPHLPLVSCPRRALNSIMCRGNSNEMQAKSFHMLNMFRHLACLFVMQQIWPEKIAGAKKLVAEKGGGGRVG